MYFNKLKGHSFAGTKLSRYGEGEGGILGSSTPFSNAKLQIWLHVVTFYLYYINHVHCKKTRPSVILNFIYSCMS